MCLIISLAIARCMTSCWRREGSMFWRSPLMCEWPGCYVWRQWLVEFLLPLGSYSEPNVISNFRMSCCIPKAMVGWERRMRSTLTEREGLSALEHLRIEIQVHSNSRWGVNNCLIYWQKMWCYSWFWMDTCKL
jgi:hypothetical protein